MLPDLGTMGSVSSTGILPSRKASCSASSAFDQSLAPLLSVVSNSFSGLDTAPHGLVHSGLEKIHLGPQKSRDVELERPSQKLLPRRRLGAQQEHCGLRREFQLRTRAPLRSHKLLDLSTSQPKWLHVEAFHSASSGMPAKTSLWGHRET